MTARASTTTVATPDQVWRVMADLLHWPTWCPTMTSVEPVDPGREPGVGASYRVRQPKLPPAHWTITSWRPGEGFVWESTAPGIRSTGTHELVSAGAVARIDLELRWSGPLHPLLELMYGRLARRYVTTEAGALARRAEREQPARP